jgi:sterol desaturase/sphingolipid hydroxylase (fatty acid hydroxylase superfamily)
MHARVIAAWVTFPVLLFGSVFAAAGLHSAGWSDHAVVFCLTFAVTLPVLVLQAWIPYEPRWRGTPADFQVDLAHFAVSNALVGSLLRAVLYDGIAWLSHLVRDGIGVNLWPAQWPIFAQVALAIVVGDFFSYWSHRACHTFPLLWRVHAVHHSAERMYALASARNHPLNVALTYGAQTLVLVAFGASAQVLLVYTVFTAVLGVLQHSNVDLRTSIFGRILSTPDLHRWHHATDDAAMDRNFGADTAIWDQVFGTRYMPSDKDARDVGIRGEQMAVNWWQHVRGPLSRQTSSAEFE